MRIYECRQFINDNMGHLEGWQLLTNIHHYIKLTADQYSPLLNSLLTNIHHYIKLTADQYSPLY